MNAYKEAQQSLQESLQNQIKQLGKKPTKEEVRKVVGVFVSFLPLALVCLNPKKSLEKPLMIGIKKISQSAQADQSQRKK